MNIVYLIGNGFDRNLGLKTSYQDFYRFYKTQVSNHENVQKVKEMISSQQSDLWSDLEIALGQISKEFNNTDAFIDVLKDISDNLRKYVKAEANSLTIKSGAKEKLIGYLCSPFENLTTEVKRSVEEHFTSQSREQWNVNIITFNYTYILEQILQDVVGSKIGTHHNGYNVNLNNILHIHGDCNTSIIVGVNDVSQIANETFKTDDDVLDWLVKTKAQECRSDGIERRCKNIISDANLICIFGMSFGETDKLWWDSIRNRLNANTNTRVVIYEYKEGVSFLDNRMQDRGRYRRQAKSKLLSKSDDRLSNTVLCDINTDMFNLKECVEKQQPLYDVKIASL